MKKIEFKPGFNFSIVYHSYDEGAYLALSLIWGTWYIPMPVLQRTREQMLAAPDFPSYGISYHDSALWWSWGSAIYAACMPWDWTFHSHHVKNISGHWVPHQSKWDGDDGRHVREFPYRYVLENGEIQNVEAEIYEDLMEWRWRWLSWSPWPAMVRRCIEVSFDQEVGERTGSYKGGVTGCGYEMLPGETPLQTLRRMEKERKL